MNILIIGSGGREHALAFKIAQSPLTKNLYAIPGNPGMAEIAQTRDMDISCHQNIVKFCQDHKIDLVIIGPELPLVNGLADDLREANIACLGPSKKAAQLEASKGFSKDLCQKFNIPTAAYARFHNKVEAKQYIDQHSYPIVIKADGLAAGKGVVIAETKEEANRAIDNCFEGTFGDAGHEIVIEEFLEGEELSYFCLCNGKDAMFFGAAQDHKRVGEGDSGANTGGMGAYSPPAILTDALKQRIEEEIVAPTMAAMQSIDAPFIGILFIGLMITPKGPELIEYNVRFGDPETQVLMMQAEGDVLPLFMNAANGQAFETALSAPKKAALTVVYAAEGYPDAPKLGTPIFGLEEINDPDVMVFHASTAMKDNQLVANGGRVLNITAKADNVVEAHGKAYAALKKIKWEGGFYRRDIGWRAIVQAKATSIKIID